LDSRISKRKEENQKHELEDRRTTAGQSLYRNVPNMMSSSSSSFVQEQLDEVLALASIFGFDGSSEYEVGVDRNEGCLRTHDEGLARFIERNSEGEDEDTSSFVQWPIRFEIVVPLESSRGSLLYRLCCMFPGQYPSVPPVVDVRSAASTRGKSVDSAMLKEMNNTIQRGIHKEDEPCIHEMIVALEDWWTERQTHPACKKAEENSIDNLSKRDKPRKISRIFFWTHHTRVKQNKIYDWAKELRISGRITVSKPGYLYAEGSTPSMGEFKKRNMSEHWKEIRITWEKTEPVEEEADVDTSRWFQDGLREVSIPAFVRDIRECGHGDILSQGTRGAMRG